ncbi:HNH endonuclease [Brevundimonas naejangsanensis]|uniref:HNH endonuclease n=1 Tax=Brevundimonas naejangsanensis TaxID=588932 RepID=UPI0039F6EB1A
MAQQNLWSDEELRVAVQIFREALDLERAGNEFRASDLSKRLAQALPGRALSSASRRLSNIAVTLKDAERPFTPKFGLSQTRAGAGVRRRILRIWDELEGGGTFNLRELEVRAAALEGKPLGKPEGNRAPPSKSENVVVYKRDPRVVAWVRRAAAGACECCGAKAPFLTEKNHPFLEVHHLRQLSQGGPDVVENTVAICPNCHRALHYAIDRDVRMESLINRVERLMRF